MKIVKYWIVFTAIITFLPFSLNADISDFEAPGEIVSSADINYETTQCVDSFGSEMMNAGDIDGDGLSDIFVSAPSSSMGYHTGKTYVFLSTDRDDSSQVHTVEYGNYSYCFHDDLTQWLSYSGEAIAAGDINGDGLSDLLISARAGTSSFARIHIFYSSSLSAAGDTDVLLSSSDCTIDLGSDTCYDLATADIDNDGLADAIIATADGYIYVIYGSTMQGLTGTVGISNADCVYSTPFTNTYYTKVSSAGDVDGDDLEDVLVSNPYYLPINRGVTCLIMGATIQSLSSGTNNIFSNTDVVFYSDTEDALSGYSVSGGGDVDGDGLSDIVIGAKGCSKTYIFYGSSLSSLGIIVNVSTANIIIEGTQTEGSGYSVAFAGDVDGDSLTDLLIGAPYDGGTVYLILGSSLTSFSSIDLANSDYAFLGEDPQDYFGKKVSSAGDVDGDGLSDLLLGTPNYHYYTPYCGTDGWGKVYLVRADSDCLNHVLNSGAHFKSIKGWTSSNGAQADGSILDSYFSLPQENSKLWQDIDIPAGVSDVYVSAQVKASSMRLKHEGFPYLYCCVLDSSNTIVQSFNTSPSRSLCWTQVGVSETLDSSGAKIRLYLMRSNKRGYSEVNEAMFDDVTVTFDCE